MNNNFENELNQFFYIIEKKEEMGCSRRINEQNDKRSNVPISNTRSKKYKQNIFYHFEIFYCEKHQKHFLRLFLLLYFTCMHEQQHDGLDLYNL